MGVFTARLRLCSDTGLTCAKAAVGPPLLPSARIVLKGSRRFVQEGWDWFTMTGTMKGLIYSSISSERWARLMSHVP